MIPLFLSGPTDFSRAQSLIEVSLDVCFKALAANRESFLDAIANFVHGFVIQDFSYQVTISSRPSLYRCT
jgi:hypothetical protein